MRAGAAASGPAGDEVRFERGRERREIAVYAGTGYRPQDLSRRERILDRFLIVAASHEQCDGQIASLRQAGSGGRDRTSIDRGPYQHSGPLT